MRGFAALALVAGFSSCVKDVDGISPAEEAEKAKENAELQLGLNIPDGQTWEMASQVEANVTIDLESSETYRVGICDKDPISNSDAKFYVFKQAENGSISTDFTAPIGKSDFYVVTYNSKNQSLVKKVEAVNGVINAVIDRNSNASRSMRSASRRATAHGITFPDAPAATDYKTTRPGDAINMNTTGGWAASSGIYYADETMSGQAVKTGNSMNTSLYLVSSTGEKVTIKPSVFYMAAALQDWGKGGAEIPVANRTHLYICPNVTLELEKTQDGGCEGLMNGLVVYIAEGAELKIVNNEGSSTPNNLVLNTLAIYNKGTITVPGDLTLNSDNDPNSYKRSVLYNQGTINVTGKLAPKNGACYVINENKITADEFGSEGSGNFWNVSGGETTITHETLVNSNSNSWVNDGKYTTNTFVYNAGSTNVYNSCKLTVKESFEIRLGDTATSTFYNEGSIVCEKDFLIAGPARINMSSNSVIDVAGTATMDCRKGDYGVYGPASGNYAVLKANQIVKGAENQGYEVSYAGNLAVICNSHFAQGWSGQYPFIGGGGEDGFGACEVTIYQGGNMPDIPAIDPTPCNPGFTPGPGPDPVPEPEVYTYAFEDQKVNGDYDMNDVVLKISYHAVREQGVIKEIDESKLDIKLVASGATFNIKVYLGQRDANGKPIENPVALFGDQEIHAAFGVSEGVMVNTGRNNANVVTLTGVTPPTGWNGDLKNLDIWIWVNPGSGSASETQIFYLTDKEKPVPYAIMIPNDWRWPTERTCITKAYPGAETSTEGVYDKDYSFAKWAETPNDQRTDNMKEWFKHPIIGLTMTNASTNSNN